uniref:Uncharacterized protein n=1 Tax=Rhizophora mucronata TaxID=61149 RepID=A0A2P2NUZ3_RHIMU
MIVCQNFLLP